jgi:GNAT superfamily N-acetyltransferase
MQPERRACCKLNSECPAADKRPLAEALVFRTPACSYELMALGISFEPATEADFEELFALRDEAMRESLTRLGRYDPARSRERFSASFEARFTRHILRGGARVGFVAVKPHQDGLLLDHLYLRLGEQGRGIGAAVLAQLFTEADAAGLALRVGALRDSASNRFYARHGFEQVGESEWDVYYRRPRGGATTRHDQAP